MRKRILAVLMAITMVSVVIAGCSGGGGQEAVEEVVSEEEVVTEEVTEEVTEDGEEVLEDAEAEEGVYVNTISDEAKEHAKTFPAVDGELPEWKGTHIVDKAEFAWPWVSVYKEPGDVHDCRYTTYREELVNEISDAGFNFVRVHIDTRYFFSTEDQLNLENVGLEFVGDKDYDNLTQYENLDRLIEWCIMKDIHVCLDVISTPGGYMLGGDEEASREGLMTPGSEDQEIFLKYWDNIAKRYADIDTRALSFNLYNEPPHFITTENEEIYIDLMNGAIDEIEAVTPDRLIFVDTLDYSIKGFGNVEALHGNNIVLGFHLYSYDATSIEMDSMDVQGNIEYAWDRLESYDYYATQHNMRWMLQEFGVSNSFPNDQAMEYLEFIVDYCNDHNVPYAQYAFNNQWFAVCTWEPFTEQYTYPGGEYTETAYGHKINMPMVEVITKPKEE